MSSTLPGLHCIDCSGTMNLLSNGNLYCPSCGLLLLDLAHYFKKKGVNISPETTFLAQAPNGIFFSDHDIFLLHAINEKINEIDPVIAMIEDCSGINKISILQFYQFRKAGISLPEWLQIIGTSLPAIDKEAINLFLEKFITNLLKNRLKKLSTKINLTHEEQIEYREIASNLK